MEQEVHFTNNRQQKLAGILELPEGKGPYGGVVLTHGFAADKNNFFFPALSKSLVDEGFAVLRFDARGCGESEGETHPTFLSMAADIECAVTFLSQQGDVGPIGLVGHSMGGTASILAAKNLARVEAVVTYGAVADAEKTVENKRKEAHKRGNYYEFILNDNTLIRLGLDFFNDAKEVQLYDKVAQLNKPLLIIHGTEDSRVNIEQGTQLFLKASMPKSFKKITGSDHWFKNYEETLINSTADFLKLWLKS